MNYDGNVNRQYIVQQLHSVFGVEWWTQADSGGEWDHGSIYSTKKEAETYIKARSFNSKKYTKIHEY